MAKFGSVWFHREIAFALRMVGVTLSHPKTTLHHGGRVYTINDDGVIEFEGERVPLNFSYFTTGGSEAGQPPPADPKTFISRWRSP